MKTRIKVIELDGEIRNIAQSKGYGKIENFFDFVYLLFSPLNGLYWKDIEEPLWVQYGLDDYGVPHSFERAVNVINEFLTDRGLETNDTSNEGLIDRDIVFINIDRVEKCFGNGDQWGITGSMSNGSWMGTFNPKVENMDQKIRDLKLDDLLD